MAFHLLPPPELVEALHDAALNPGDLPESALDKSRDGALARVENRLAYDLIGDAFVLAAAYAAAIAQGHCFNNAHKRPAFDEMNFCLELHGIVVDCPIKVAGDQIIKLAQRLRDEGELAEWLRQRS